MLRWGHVHSHIFGGAAVNAALALATGVGSAAVGGVYLAFSVMVMPALARRPNDEATAAMQAINVRAERGPFGVIFVATTIAAVALGAMAVPRLSEPGAALELTAAALSVASSVVTGAANVPRNGRLAREGARYWPTFHPVWTRFNSVRAALALAAVAALLVAQR